MTEAVCDRNQRDVVVQLGRIKVDIMNRAPMELDIKRWKRVNTAHATGFAHCSTERTWIDLVSFITWKERFNPSFDLGCLKVPVEILERHGAQRSMASVWSSTMYRKPARAL
jgi:hypothetical protein